MQGSNNPFGRIVDATRRRRPGPSRGRADTPFRQNFPGGTGGGSSPFSPTGSPVSGGGTSFPRIPIPGCGGTTGCLGIVVIVIIVLVFLAFQYFGQCDLGGFFGETIPPTTTFAGSPQIATLPAASPFVTSIVPVAAPAPPVSGQKWLVMLYQDADDKVLEKDICFDANEAEMAGSSGRVTIVTQLDRYNGAYTGDGNWTDTRRYLLKPDNDLNRLNSQQVGSLGEADMASSQTLADFINWAVRTYPAERYALILSDHGMGWPGGWSDATARGSGDPNIPIQSDLGEHLFLNQIDSVLGQVRAANSIDKFDVVGLDACLMSQLEVYTALAPHARYAVASEETEPALGWAYAAFLRALNQNPDMDGAVLSQAIVKSYIEQDESVLDSGARGDFLKAGSPLAGLFGSGGSGTNNSQLAQQIGQESTLSAIDLSKVSALNASLNHLSFLFQQAKSQALASARTYSQSYTNIFGSDVPASYIDLGNFLQLVKQKSGNATINQAADAVMAAIDTAVIAEKHGAKLPGSTGIAIYFPNSELYGYSIGGARSYTGTANRFAAESLWDDFLAFFYTGRAFKETDAAPVVPTATVRAPAAGGITVSAVRVSSATAAPGSPITLTADITGQNIGHIYLFAGFFDPVSNSIFVADRDFLDSGTTRQVDGVYYPDWGQGNFTLRFTWDPIVFAISNGTDAVSALFTPQDFGRTFEEAVYNVDGWYTYAGTGEQVRAQATFVDGVMRQVFVFTGTDAAAAPREVTPAAGDRFTVMDTWLELDSSGKIVNTATEQGDTLTFGNQMFTWETLDAAAGDYFVGFVIEDLDGNQQWSLTKITVR